MQFSGEIIDTRLRLEVFTDRPEAEFRARTRRGGLYTMPFELDITDPRKPIQLRVFIDQGEISGHMHFSQVTIRPLFDLPAAHSP